MRRARHPVSLRLNSLTCNLKTGRYEIEENGILYSMDLEQTRLLKKYFVWWKHGDGRTIAKWYDELNKEDRKFVLRSGNVPKVQDDFYPDISYD